MANIIVQDVNGLYYQLNYEFYPDVGLYYTGIVNTNPSGYITGLNTGNLVDSSRTGSFVSAWQTGLFVDQTMTGQFISAWQTGALLGAWQTGALVGAWQTGSLVGRWQTGTFIDVTMTGNLYPNYNPSGYLTGLVLFEQTGFGPLIRITGTVAGSLIGSGIGSMTVPANYFNHPGKSLNLHIQGLYTANSSTQNITGNLKLGNQALVSVQTKANTANLNNALFDINANITCWTTGVSGLFMANGTTVNAWASAQQLVSTTGVPILPSTTGALLVDFTLQGISGTIGNGTGITYQSTYVQLIQNI